MLTYAEHRFHCEKLQQLERQFLCFWYNNYSITVKIVFGEYILFKLAHISDLHAGYKSTRRVNAQGINLREADGYVALHKIVSEIIENECDAVVCAGDIFHFPTPEVRAVIFVQNQLRRLWKARIPVYLLAGNHDTNDVKADIAASRILHDPWRNIHSHVEPYVVHEIADGINLHMVSHHMYSEQKHTMKDIATIDDSINIFSTHGSCIDPLLQMKLHTDQSPREIVIPDKLMNDFEWDYTLLGHIHERGWIGSKDKKTDSMNKKVFYNGSIVRRGFSDKEVPLGRGWTLWNIDSNGVFTPEIKKVAQRPQFDFNVIDAKDLTSGEITDQIIENLVATQTNGIEFDNETAPMLRQRIVNLTPAKHAGLDLKNIDLQSSHALIWSIKPITLEEEISLDSNVTVGEITETGDIVKIFDKWSKDSKVLTETSKELKDKVREQARNFVQLGQETTLESQ